MEYLEERAEYRQEIILLQNATTPIHEAKTKEQGSTPGWPTRRLFVQLLDQK